MALAVLMPIVAAMGGNGALTISNATANPSTGTSLYNTDTWTGSSVPGAQVGTCTLAATGNPNDAYAVRLEILRAGATLASGAATYRLSLDGGDTWGPETAMPVGGVITPSGTGLTLTFTYSSGAAFAVKLNRNDFLRGLEIGAVSGLLDVGSARGSGGIDVD